MKALRLPVRVSAVAYWFRFRCPRLPPCSCSPQRSWKIGGPLPGQGSCSAGALTVRLAVRGRERDLSGLQAIHPVPLLRSTTPVEPKRPRHSRSPRCCPRYPYGEGFGIGYFGANPQLRHLLPYASGVALPPHLQGLLPAGWLSLYREGVEPSGSLRKVSGRLTIILLSCSPDANGLISADAVRRHVPLDHYAAKPIAVCVHR
jgi:hypothetical protein